MAGIRKEPEPSAERVAANLYRIRHGERDITTATMAERLKQVGHPVGATGITKTEKGTRRVDVDDLVPFALVLGVTPNTLLMPPVSHVGAADVHQLTPEVSGTAEELWQWAQGEHAIPVLVPGARAWLGGSDYPVLEFPLRTRPYLTAPRPAAAGNASADPAIREMTSAMMKARKAGATDAEIRRAVELTFSLPVLMTVPEYRDRLRGEES